MNKDLLQPAATITASMLSAVAAAHPNRQLPDDTVKKLFLLAYRQLEEAQKELEKPQQGS